jgi:hypothetical protein
MVHTPGGQRLPGLLAKVLERGEGQMDWYHVRI